MLKLPPACKYVVSDQISSIVFTYFLWRVKDLTVWITFLEVGCVHGV